MTPRDCDHAALLYDLHRSGILGCAQPHGAQGQNIARISAILAGLPASVGGSIAIGHPFEMTGSRMVGTIANEMARQKARYGVVTMCIGGGQGAAALFERAN